MKLLIDIPDWLYHHIVDFGILESDVPELYWAVYTGKKIAEENKEEKKNEINNN